MSPHDGVPGPTSLKPQETHGEPGESAGYRAYVKRRKRRALAIVATQLFLIVAILGLWEIAARLGWINAFFMSQPSRVWRQIVQMAAGDLWFHLGVTIGRTFVGFMAATVGGVLIASILWWSSFLARVVDPYLIVLNSVPKVALGPMFIIWLGTNVKAVVAMTIAITIVVTIVMVYTAFRDTDPDKIKLLRSFGGTRTQTFRKVVFPSAVPTIMAALKVNIGLAWVGTIMGEFLVSGSGLGYLIIYGGQVFNMHLVMASVALLLVASTAAYFLMDRLERRYGRGERA